jgi:hypothetical protein
VQRAARRDSNCAFGATRQQGTRVGRWAPNFRPVYEATTPKRRPANKYCANTHSPVLRVPGKEGGGAVRSAYEAANIPGSFVGRWRISHPAPYHLDVVVTNGKPYSGVRR